MAIHQPEAAVVLGRRRFGSAAELWATPGGGVLYRESLHAAALRELREETGLEGDIAQGRWANSNFVYELPQADPPKLIVGCVVNVWRPKLLKESEEFSELRWVRGFSLQRMHEEGLLSPATAALLRWNSYL